MADYGVEQGDLNNQQVNIFLFVFLIFLFFVIFLTFFFFNTR